MNTRSMMKQLNSSDSEPMMTRSMTKKLNSPQSETKVELETDTNKLILPTKNNQHYKWAKNNNLFFTEQQVKDMGLDIDDHNKVIGIQFISGSGLWYSPYKAVAPEGYYWEADMQHFKKDFSRKIFGYVEMDLDEYKDDMCDLFVLREIQNKETNKRIHN
jgi:hypothetical protein